MKKGLKLLMAIVMIMSFVIPVKAVDVDFSQVLDNNVIKVGYTEVYTDSKPAIPPSQLVYHIQGNNIDTKAYKTILVDDDNNEIMAVEGTFGSSSNDLIMNVPGNTKDGHYVLKTTVDGVTVVSDVIILNNYNLGSQISTNVTNYSGGTWDLVDGIQWGMFTPKDNKPTQDSPAEFVFEFDKLIDVYAFGVASTYGNDQGPKTGEILYWDNEIQAWKNILNNGNKNFDFHWVTNGACEMLMFDFSKAYTTNKMMLRVTDSNTTWENTNNVVEVQTWGYEIGELPSIDMDFSEGIVQKENTISLVIKNPHKVEKTTVHLELVDSLSLKPLSQPVKYQATMVDGKLEYRFIIPKSVDLGAYRVRVSYDDYLAYSDEYYIGFDRDVNMKDVSKYFNISLEDDYTQKVTTINDDNLTTSWKYKGDTSLLLEVKPENNKFANIVLKNIKVYADKDSISQAILKLVADTNYYRHVDKNSHGKINTLIDYTPIWETDDKGDYFIIDPQFLSFGNIFVLDLKTDNTIKIDEVIVEGIHLGDNQFAKAEVTHNGKVIDAFDMTDNVVGSYYKTEFHENDVYEFDFSPRTVTANEILYTAHFPSSQGVSKVKVETWNNGSWKEQGIYQLNHKTDNEIRESQQLVFEEVTTSKIRLTVIEANKVWDNSYLFSDINILGTVHDNAQYIADTLDTKLVINQGDKKVVLPKIEGYDVEIATSSHQNIIDLSGNIYATSKDENVVLTLKVINKKNTKDVGMTKNISVFVPRSAKNQLMSFEYDDTSVYNNPAMGWVQYYEYTNESVDKYWEDMDKLYEKGLQPSILYIRNLWSWFEPEEGKYAWKDPHSQLSQLVKGARDRDLQIAFRVVVDSTDMWQQAVPKYVTDAGAKGYLSENCNDKSALDPYINDPIFLEKFEKFIKAFAEEYNDDLDIAYIDGMGFGDWGEGHGVRFHTDYADSSKSDIENLTISIRNIVNIYNDYFPDVLLGTMEGQSERYGTEKTSGFVNNDIVYVETFEPEYDWVIRKDTFGWMNDKIRNRLLDYFNQGIPIYAEDCYHSFQVREYWYNNAGFPTLDSILRQVISDALYVRANTLDARTVMDCESWLDNDLENYHNDGLLNLFGVKGGYRLAPTTIEFPKTMIKGHTINVTSAWRNYGVGILPNNNAHWNNKYKVAYALLDSQTHEVVYQYNESSDNINPGDWLLEDGNNRYDSHFVVPTYIASGKYKLAVSIVNEKNEYKPEIELALKNIEMTKEGWYIIDSVNIYNEGEIKVDSLHNITFDTMVNGRVIADKTEVKTGDSVTLTIKPNKGYMLSQLMINNVKVDVNGSVYVVKDVQNDLFIQATFKKIPGYVDTSDSTLITSFIIGLLFTSIGIIIFKKKNT